MSVAEPGERKRGLAEGEEREGPATGVGGESGGRERRGGDRGGELNRLSRSAILYQMSVGMVEDQERCTYKVKGGNAWRRVDASVLLTSSPDMRKALWAAPMVYKGGQCCQHHLVLALQIYTLSPSKTTIYNR